MGCVSEHQSISASKARRKKKHGTNTLQKSGTGQRIAQDILFVSKARLNFEFEKKKHPENRHIAYNCHENNIVSLSYRGISFEEVTWNVGGNSLSTGWCWERKASECPSMSDITPNTHTHKA